MKGLLRRLRADWAARYAFMCRGVESPDHWKRWTHASGLTETCYQRPWEEPIECSRRALFALQQKVFEGFNRVG